MVERLKTAVEKARAERGFADFRNAGGRVQAGFAPSSRVSGRPTVRQQKPRNLVADCDAAASAWQALEQIVLDPEHLERNRVITEAQTEPAHIAFDVLRTRVLRTFETHGWTRLGITSPTAACGKTFVASNLALSLARQVDCRTILTDLDLRAPSLASVLGVAGSDPIRWVLSGDVAPHDHLRRVGTNLALGLNAERLRNSAEMMLAPTTAEVLRSMLETFAPDIAIYDLPPLLSCDDVLGFLPQLDCVLLVAGGGRTRPAQIRECERLLADQSPLLGVILNQAEDATRSHFGNA